MNWDEYRAYVVPILRDYRNDALSSSEAECKLSAVDSKIQDNRYHDILKDFIWEKPCLDHLNETYAHGKKILNEYDMLIDALIESSSFKDAGEKADKIWGR